MNALEPGDLTGKPAIVHVSADFPDPIAPEKTPVIRALIALTADRFAHRVISLNRRMPGLDDLLRPNPAEGLAFEWGEAWSYAAPPLGVLHATLLRRLGRQVAAALVADPPALLVGHKLTIEGLVVAEAARALCIPFAITVQGNTDLKILSARPDLARSLADVFHSAAMVFAFAPWSLDQVEQRLGKRCKASRMVPCPTDLDTPLPPVAAGEGLVSAFHLRHFRNKNLRGLASALRLLRQAGENTPFSLLGGGNEADLRSCAAALKGIDQTAIVSGLDRVELRAALNRATGFVLASHRESFGLVFVEALMAGLPVIYPENRAIAGWFDELPFAIPVDPANPQAIAAAMRRLVREERELKRALANWQQSARARKFMRSQIAAEFSTGLEEALGYAARPLATAGKLRNKAGHTLRSTSPLPTKAGD